jgi:NADH:ubiquinone oxidoreductase subunit B-like Fe-S oxidoreductase
LENPNKHH